MTPGYWMVRCCRGCPEVAARIWRCDHEPGDPKNKVDQPYWQGQLGLDLTDPGEIWVMLEFCEAAPEAQLLMIAPPQSTRAPRNGRSPALVTAPMAKWKRERARRIGLAEYEHQIRWLQWAERNSPGDPRLSYRRPVPLSAVPVPLFEREAR